MPMPLSPPGRPGAIDKQTRDVLKVLQVLKMEGREAAPPWASLHQIEEPNGRDIWDGREIA